MGGGRVWGGVFWGKDTEFLHSYLEYKWPLALTSAPLAWPHSLPLQPGRGQVGSYEDLG